MKEIRNQIGISGNVFINDKAISVVDFKRIYQEIST